MKDPKQKVLLNRWTGRPPHPGIDCSKPVITEQHHRDSVDRNKIINSYLKGQPLPVDILQPLFVDAPDVSSYQDALEQVEIATDLFRQLPSRIRTQFQNDPVKFADFVVNPKNSEALISMGLASASVSPGGSPKVNAPEPTATSSKTKSGAPDASPKGGDGVA